MSEENDIIERLASLEHEQWIKWSKEISKTEKISKDRIQRWKKFWIPYSELSEETKEHDRVWAKKVLALLNGLTCEGCLYEKGAYEFPCMTCLRIAEDSYEPK